MIKSEKETILKEIAHFKDQLGYVSGISKSLRNSPFEDIKEYHAILNSEYEEEILREEILEKIVAIKKELGHSTELSKELYTGKFGEIKKYYDNLALSYKIFYYDRPKRTEPYVEGCVIEHRHNLDNRDKMMKEIKQIYDTLYKVNECYAESYNPLRVKELIAKLVMNNITTHELDECIKYLKYAYKREIELVKKRELELIVQKNGDIEELEEI